MQKQFERTKELCKKMFPDFHFSKEMDRTMMALLLEEAGELSGATRSFFGRTYRPDVEAGNLEDIKGEIGDCIYVIFRICQLWNVTPDECLKLVEEKLEKRYQEKLLISSLLDAGMSGNECVAQ